MMLRNLSLLMVAAIANAGWEPIEATVSSYCPCPLCTPGLGITANGTRTSLVPYGIAVSRSAESRIPLGSVIWIPAGEGYLDVSRADDRMFVVDDRMSKRWTGIRIDLRYKTHWSAQQFGVKKIVVWIWRD